MKYLYISIICFFLGAIAVDNQRNNSNETSTEQTEKFNSSNSNDYSSKKHTYPRRESTKITEKNNEFTTPQKQEQSVEAKNSFIVKARVGRFDAVNYEIIFTGYVNLTISEIEGTPVVTLVEERKVHLPIYIYKKGDYTFYCKENGMLTYHFNTDRLY